MKATNKEGEVMNMESIDMRDLGRCLRSVREAIGLSAEELGERVGIHGPTITRFEVGRAQNPTFETVFKLLDYLGEQELLREGKFDFGKYNTTTARVFNAFRKGEQGYKDCRDEQILYLYQNRDYLPATVLDAVTLVVESNKNFQKDGDALSLIDSKVESSDRDVKTVPFSDLMSRMFEQNGKEFNNVIANMVTAKTRESIADYTHKTLALLYAYVVLHFENRIAEGVTEAK